MHRDNKHWHFRYIQSDAAALLVAVYTVGLFWALFWACDCHCAQENILMLEESGNLYSNNKLTINGILGRDLHPS